jgi:hypothetical protein
VLACFAESAVPSDWALAWAAVPILEDMCGTAFHAAMFCYHLLTGHSLVKASCVHCTALHCMTDVAQYERRPEQCCGACMVRSVPPTFAWSALRLKSPPVVSTVITHLQAVRPVAR